MTGRKTGKTNQVLQEWPKGTVATQTWFDRFGVSRKLANWHVGSGRLVRFGSRAFAQPSDRVEWQGGLYALQAQLGMTVHVGGRTALELQGRSHFVPLGRQAKVTLVSDQPEQLPTWFRNHQWTVRVEHRCLSLFKFKQVLDKATTSLECGGFKIVISSAERAIMEQMRLANNNDQIEQANQLMEGLSTLRPDVVQALLESCQSAKVKRLFLWCAETAGHEWFGRLDSSRFDLGKGKRQIYKGGELNQKYRITIPKSTELPRV